MRIYLSLYFVILYISITSQPTFAKSSSFSKTTDFIKPQKSKQPKVRNSDTFFKSKSYQSMIVMNGSGPPVSEKKMSVFSVEDHNGGNE